MTLISNLTCKFDVTSIIQQPTQMVFLAGWLCYLHYTLDQKHAKLAVVYRQSEHYMP